MSEHFLICAIEDEPATQLVLEEQLGEHYQVSIFGSAEEFLASKKTERADLFLIDVGLPGMTGYELCRKIKETPELRNIPVMFVSSHDRIEKILAGYDVGAEDYIVKPFDFVILNRKIENLRRIQKDKKIILEQAKSSEQLASLVLSNLDEYAVLVKFLRSINSCTTPQSLISALFKLFGAYHLNCVIQVSCSGVELVCNQHGEASPLEVSVISHMRTMDRIFEFKSRTSYNFEQISVLVNNTPVHDPDLCGRLRDHLAIAVETANSKLEELQLRTDFNYAACTVAELFAELNHQVTLLDRGFSGARSNSRLLAQKLQDDLAKAFASLGLSDEQESAIDQIIQVSTDEIANAYEFNDSTQNSLCDIANRLQKLLTTVRFREEVFRAETTASSSANVELF